MNRKHASEQKNTGISSTDDTLEILSLKRRGAVCQLCESRLQDGEHAGVYAMRAHVYTPWIVGQVRCVNHPLSLDSLATLGIDEVTATGRVARVVDQAHQRDWPVILAEDVEAISQPHNDGAAEPPLPAVPDSARPTPHNHSPGGQT